MVVKHWFFLTITNKLLLIIYIFIFIYSFVAPCRLHRPVFRTGTSALILSCAGTNQLTGKHAQGSGGEIEVSDQYPIFSIAGSRSLVIQFMILKLLKNYQMYNHIFFI